MPEIHGTAIFEIEHPHPDLEMEVEIEVITISADELKGLTFDVSEVNEREMGPEITYEASFSIFDKGDNEHEITIKIHEYPTGVINIVEMDGYCVSIAQEFDVKLHSEKEED